MYRKCWSHAYRHLHDVVWFSISFHLTTRTKRSKMKPVLLFPSAVMAVIHRLLFLTKYSIEITHISDDWQNVLRSFSTANDANNAISFKLLLCWLNRTEENEGTNPKKNLYASNIFFSFILLGCNQSHPSHMTKCITAIGCSHLMESKFRFFPCLNNLLFSVQFKSRRG